MSTLLIFDKLQVPDRDAILREVIRVGTAIGLKSFTDWMTEYAHQDKQVKEFLDQRISSTNVAIAESSIEEWINLAQTVVDARKSGELAKQMATGTRINFRRKLTTDENIADFLSVSLGLLYGEEVFKAILSLHEPFGAIAGDVAVKVSTIKETYRDLLAS